MRITAFAATVDRVSGVAVRGGGSGTGDREPGHCPTAVNLRYRAEG